MSSPHNDAQAIAALGASHGVPELAQRAIIDGTSLETFRTSLLAHLHARRAGALLPPNGAGHARTGVVDSFERVLRALVSDDTATRDGHGGNRACVTWSSLRAQRAGANTADFLGAISTDARVEEASPALREHSTLVRLGARVLEGLSGNVDVPVVEGAVAKIGTETAVEGGETPTEASKISLLPQSGRAFTPISRRALVQSSGAIQTLVKDDLLGAIAELIDSTGLEVILGAAELVAPSQIGESSPFEVDHFRDAIALRTQLELQKYPARRRAYVAHPNVIGELSLPYVAGGVAFPAPFVGTPQDGRLNATPCGQHSAVESLLYGEFSECFVGLFGPGVEIDLGPADNAGVRYLRAWVEFDVALRRPAFATIGESE